MFLTSWLACTFMNFLVKKLRKNKNSDHYINCRLQRIASEKHDILIYICFVCYSFKSGLTVKKEPRLFVVEYISK